MAMLVASGTEPNDTTGHGPSQFLLQRLLGVENGDGIDAKAGEALIGSTTLRSRRYTLRHLTTITVSPRIWWTSANSVGDQMRSFSDQSFVRLVTGGSRFRGCGKTHSLVNMCAIFLRLSRTARATRTKMTDFGRWRG